VKTPPDSGFTFEEVRREELELLKESQDAPGLDSGDVSDQLMGLAFSGGGIRSATFNLGVLQALSELKLLAEFDYLSTVSGGGYIGSWLSAWIHRSDARNLEQEEETEKRTGRRPQHTPGVRACRSASA
jgi:predicted acylesterase/phospholipase RssA